MVRRSSPELEREIRRLVARGHSLREVGRLVDCSKHGVTNVLARPPADPEEWNPSPARLSLAEREEIRAGLERGDTFTTIAGHLDRAISTVSRDVAANGGRVNYQAWRAHQEAGRHAKRPKRAKLACPRLVALVTAGLEAWWSPEEISRRLRVDFPDDPTMWLSHETIYQSLFVPGRGELRRELHRCLRTGRARRRPRSRMGSPGRIRDMKMISERPPEADDRTVAGHWEGDLIIGQDGRSAVGTLVERTTRVVVLLHLPDGREATKVTAALKKAVGGLPQHLRRSLAWDQGREMAGHGALTADTAMPVYFCDPHSPWQRPLNENTNGLLRQYMPKGTDLSLHSADDLARIAKSLNDRPRKILGYMTPSEKFAELLALTA
jgi:IS30 family transposase